MAASRARGLLSAILRNRSRSLSFLTRLGGSRAASRKRVWASSRSGRCGGPAASGWRRVLDFKLRETSMSTSLKALLVAAALASTALAQNAEQGKQGANGQYGAQPSGAAANTVSDDRSTSAPVLHIKSVEII